jgi:hypothetical protein
MSYVWEEATYILEVLHDVESIRDSVRPLRRPIARGPRRLSLDAVSLSDWPGHLDHRTTPCCRGALRFAVGSGSVFGLRNRVAFLHRVRRSVAGIQESLSSRMING